MIFKQNGMSILQTLYAKIAFSRNCNFGLMIRSFNKLELIFDTAVRKILGKNLTFNIFIAPNFHAKNGSYA